MRITYQQDIFLLTFYNQWHHYRLNSSIYVANRCHCYATFIKCGGFRYSTRIWTFIFYRYGSWCACAFPLADSELLVSLDTWNKRHLRSVFSDLLIVNTFLLAQLQINWSQSVTHYSFHTSFRVWSRRPREMRSAQIQCEIHFDITRSDDWKSQVKIKR